MTPSRNRPLLVIVAALTIAAGLATRHEVAGIPRAWLANLGDGLWSVAVYLGYAFIAPRARPVTLGIVTAITSAAVECSQLYHAPWIDGIRSTTLGGLALGYAFAWGDLACYLAASLVCVALDTGFATRRRGTSG